MSDLCCINCKRDIAPDEPVYEIRTTLDPLPPRGFACSVQCQQQKESESKRRAMFWMQSPLGPFGGGKDE